MTCGDNFGKQGRMWRADGEHTSATNDIMLIWRTVEPVIPETKDSLDDL